MSQAEIKAYLASIGRKGGKASKRTLTPGQARAMVEAREKKKASRENGKKGGRPKARKNKRRE